MSSTPPPSVLDADLVGSFEAETFAGGGYVWDEVLEYRVWMCPENGAADEFDGNDYFQAFASYEEASAYHQSTKGSDEPIALVLQREHIDEPEDGVYELVRESRVTEWPLEFLARPRRDEAIVQAFLDAVDDPNRLDILRGVNTDQ